mgnify:CR=1 FL=1
MRNKYEQMSLFDTYKSVCASMEEDKNTTGVMEIVEMTPAFLGRQIDVVFEDIPPDAVKIGMVASCGLIETIADDGAHGKNTVHGHRFQIGLNPGASAGVGPSD